MALIAVPRPEVLPGIAIVEINIAGVCCRLGVHLANCCGGIDGVHDFQVSIDLLAHNAT